MNRLPVSTIAPIDNSSIHPDCKIHLNSEQWERYGDARFIDALTFLRHYPNAVLHDSFILGEYFYESINETSSTSTSDCTCAEGEPFCESCKGSLVREWQET